MKRFGLCCFSVYRNTAIYYTTEAARDAQANLLIHAGYGVVIFKRRPDNLTRGQHVRHH